MCPRKGTHAETTCCEPPGPQVTLEAGVSPTWEHRCSQTWRLADGESPQGLVNRLIFRSSTPKASGLVGPAGTHRGVFRKLLRFLRVARLGAAQSPVQRGQSLPT